MLVQGKRLMMTLESINMELRPSAMSTGRKFFRDVTSMITEPGNFYQNLQAARNRRDYITFIGFTAVIYSAAAALFTTSHQAVFLAFYLLNALLMPAVTGLALYPALRALKAKSYSFDLLLAIAAYANVVLLLAWIPGFAPWAEIYKYVLIGLGLTKIGNISGIKAFVAIVAAAALLLIMIHFLQYLLGI
jgi:hypothetical protein